MTKNVCLRPHFKSLCMLPGIISMVTIGVTDIFLLQYFKKFSIEQFRGENSFYHLYCIYFILSALQTINVHFLNK